jgi:two-component system CitB family sensor kinase
MHSIHGLMETMRALEHEYANRLHIVDGLLEWGSGPGQELHLGIVQRVQVARRRLPARIAPPELAALLSVNSTVAAEGDLQIEVTRSPGQNLRRLTRRNC